MIPIQLRSVDPHSSYDSDNVNRLTRLITNGKDFISDRLQLYPTVNNSTNIKITAGTCVKDDVVIYIENDQLINVTNVNNYTEKHVLSAPFPKVVYIVLQYQYSKQPVPNQAELLILNNPLNFDTDLHVFLGTVTFNTVASIIAVGYKDNSIIRHYLSISDSNKYSLEVTSLDYNINNEYVLNHNLKRYPDIVVVDYSTGEQLTPRKIVHLDENNAKIMFDELYPTPHVYISY